MAAAPRFKVYTDGGLYLAACKFAEDAAALVAVHGDGATIRAGHRKADVVWTEGQEDQPAFWSYDYVADTINGRLLRRAPARLRQRGEVTDPETGRTTSLQGLRWDE